MDVTPHWDPERRTLSVGGVVVKAYRVPACNQVAVLAAFQESGWPIRIDDPLKPLPEIVPNRRLLDTIKSLNRHQKTPLIRFRGDGTGQGISWELAAFQTAP